MRDLSFGDHRKIRANTRQVVSLSVILASIGIALRDVTFWKSRDSMTAGSGSSFLPFQTHALNQVRRGLRS
jgi:hypothetical protein